jgi:hypothetical protein
MTTAQATGFEIVKEAMAVLEFYRGYYTSSGTYQERLHEVIALLRNRAETFQKGPNYGEYKFIMMFAAALEISNQPGEYLPVPNASA